MADSASEEMDGLLDEEQFDVTSTCNKIICCCLFKTTLTLEPEEAVLTTSTCFSNNTKRMPYGELGSVEHSTACGCCHSFSSNLSPEGENGKIPISPGCGCEGALVEEIVSQLKARMKGRGDTGNIRRAEESLMLTKELMTKVDLILRQMQIPAPEVMQDQVANTPLEHKEYDVTSCCHKICSCGSQIMNLDPEEVLVKTTTLCSTSNSRRPYGELGSVDENQCCGFSCVSSGMGAFCPGIGCSHDLVQELVQELKTRMKLRGDTGNIQRQEETLMLIKHQELKVDAILKKLGIPLPPKPGVPAQLTMS